MSDTPYPAPIHLSLIGIDTMHEPGYTVHRRTGSREYLFEFFDSPVTIQDERESRTYPGNVFIVYAPGQPQYFRAEVALTHTWFAVSGTGVSQCLETYHIPTNQVVAVARPDFLAPLLKEALQHTVRKQRHWEDAVTGVFRTLFRRLARTLYQGASIERSPYEKQVIATLHQVRAQVYKDLKRRWTVEEMAALASMSPQRFAVVYRSTFGTGPIDDLIDVRLRHAEVLLRHLPMTVMEVAQHFGFNSVSHFHVLFRERMGRSPRQMRRASDRVSASLANPENPFAYQDAVRRVNLLYIAPAGHWSFDGTNAVVDDLGKHLPAALHNDVTRGPGRCGGNALLFNGAGHAILPEAVVDTARSYTVSAWVQYRHAVKMTAISIGNPHHGAFYLQYVPSEGGFKFAVTVSERDPLAIFVVSDTPPAVGEWHHITGVHDRESREIRLYVNGKLAGRTHYQTPWSTDGATYFGCSQVMDTILDRWYGSIDDVRLYDRALSAAEIEMLYQSEGNG